MLRTVGAAAAGVAVGSLAFAKPAGATDGNAITIGNAVQDAQSPTLLIVDGPDYSATPLVGAFHVTDDVTQTNANMAFSCISAIATGDPMTIAFAGAGSSVGAKFDGPVPLKLTDSTNSAAPTSASGTEGQFKQVNGDLWFCVKSETGAGNVRCGVACPASRLRVDSWRSIRLAPTTHARPATPRPASWRRTPTESSRSKTRTTVRAA
jgi:hypothetical protein